MTTDGVITRIEKQRGRTQRYHLYRDDVYWGTIHEEVLVKKGLRKGLSLGAEEWGQIGEAEERSQVRQSALRHLSYKPRTAHEVRRFLLQKEYEEHHVEEIISECIDHGYIDDDRFATAWVAERMQSKGLGKRVLRQELERKGISIEVINQAVAQIEEEDEWDMALMMAEKRYPRLAHLPWPTVERRLSGYLLRRGYSASHVFQIMQQLRDNHQVK
ncbi:regulatory protein RecX [Mechercharimyces sp. CAU 1602]|uniref:regulatory protein RecX n=1 Tax=Mechercharimyces sp. CAU 1602 TaxID=2973933 RepID=UPI002162D64D|nr:RecX family transcriptional regulator [Mechercharimyces sp. CAU 1602]MCS1351231.1 RecX family transcriptional regulator [Mechercharimyces sp. CAU 1602]